MNYENSLKSLIIMYYSSSTHCVKSVHIWSYFWSVFSYIRSEYRKIRTRNNSVFAHFSRSEPDQVLLSYDPHSKNEIWNHIGNQK